MRGVSGSGKSTKAQELGKGGVTMSTDDYWGPDYDFDRSKIGQAHEWNQNRAREAMEQGLSPLVIDGTNTQLWEMKPYVESGVANGYDIEFHESDTPWRFDAEELAKRNRHGTPIEVIKQMLRNWEPNATVEGVLSADRSKSPDVPETPQEES